MFPIRDPRGRCIAFGGRALSADAQAKYLNSPETDLFHKGRVLFNHGPAGDAARNSGTLVVTEGYMDVIALAQAGFDHAVAPLGTAVTEEQVGLMWRLAPEPIIALDGDTAGLRAANRLIDNALPLLQPGKSLRFCLMPEGKDPDDLIRDGGAPAMAAALEAAIPLVDMLWRREAEAEPIDTPERKAALDNRLRDALGRIADTGVRNHYGAELRQRRSELFRPPERQRSDTGRGFTSRPGRFKAPQGPAPTTRNSSLASTGGQTDAMRIREAAILLIALSNHRHIAPVEEALESMTLRTPEFETIRAGLIEARVDGEDPIARITAMIGEDPVHLLQRLPQARAHPQATPCEDGARVASVLAEAISRHQSRIDFAAEQAEARHDFNADGGEDVTWRLRQAGQHRLNADREGLESESTSETGNEVSPLQRMLENETYKRKKKRPPPTNQ